MFIMFTNKKWDFYFIETKNKIVKIYRDHLIYLINQKN